MRRGGVGEALASVRTVTRPGSRDEGRGSPGLLEGKQDRGKGCFGFPRAERLFPLTWVGSGLRRATTGSINNLSVPEAKREGPQASKQVKEDAKESVNPPRRSSSSSC